LALQKGEISASAGVLQEAFQGLYGDLTVTTDLKFQVLEFFQSIDQSQEAAVAFTLFVEADLKTADSFGVSKELCEDFLHLLDLASSIGVKTDSYTEAVDILNSGDQLEETVVVRTAGTKTVAHTAHSGSLGDEI